MRLLKMIGEGFARLWRWIKETAWIQPLLIVGAIFALIFSIPYFTSWIQSISADSANYFARYQLTLEGEPSGNTTSLTVTTEADKITASIYENSNFENEDSFTPSEEATAYGYKFFLVFCDEDSSDVTDAAEAFETLSDNWNVNYIPSATHRTESGASITEELKVYTIFTDETSSNDDDDGMEDDSAFQRYLKIQGEFFEEAASRLSQYTPYVKNASIDSSYYEDMASCDESEFQVPTIMLVDYTYEASQLAQSGTSISTRVGRVGASEVIFSLSGDSKYENAETLINMWNHTDTTDKSNPFTANYSNN